MYVCKVGGGSREQGLWMLARLRIETGTREYVDVVAGVNAEALFGVCMYGTYVWYHQGCLRGGWRIG